MARVTSFGSGIQGAAEIERRLQAIGKEMSSRIIQTATRAGAKPMQQAVQAAAPDGPRAEGEQVGPRTHNKIKNSIRIKKGKSKFENAAVVIVHTGLAFHALFQERGTIHIAPRPFMAEAISGARQSVLDAMRKALERGLARAARVGA